MASRPWHKADPAEFLRLEELIGRAFTDLHFSERDGQLVLTGHYAIVVDGNVVDRYLIQIAVPPGGPRSGIPRMREVGGRIPHTAERHIDRDGMACLFVPDEFWYMYPNGMDLLDFLERPVRGFLIGQSLVECGEPWPYGERPHGSAGIVGFYSSVLGTNDLDQVKAYLATVVSRELRGHVRCPCRSGRRIRDCHWNLLQDLRRRIPSAAAQRSIEMLERPADERGSK